MGKAPVDAVETSFHVLQRLAEEAPASVTDVAQRLNRPKATVYYHLQTLEKHGYVVRRGGGYDLGLRTLELGGRARERRRPTGVVASNLKRLAKEANEIAVFGIAEREAAVILDVEWPIGPTTDVDVAVGKHLPLHASALGKALLAAMPEAGRRSTLEGYEYEQFTRDTVLDEGALREELTEIQADGHAHDRGEHDPDVHGVAAAVTGDGGGVAGAIGIVGPASRLYSDRFAHELPHLVERFAGRVEDELRA